MEFGSQRSEVDKIEELYKVESKKIEELKNILQKQKEMIFYINTSKDENEEKIVKEKIEGIGIFNKEYNQAYYIELKENEKIQELKDVFESDRETVFHFLEACLNHL